MCKTIKHAFSSQPAFDPSRNADTGSLSTPFASQVGLCKIADAFYASEGKGESRRSAIETLAGGDSLAGAKGSQEPASGSNANGEEQGGQEEHEEAKQAAPLLSAQSLPEACGGSIRGDAAGESTQRVNISVEDGACVAGSSGQSDAANEGSPSTPAAAAGDTASVLEEAAGSSREETVGQDKNNETNIPNTTGANASTEAGGSSGGDNATRAGAPLDLASTGTGGSGGGNGGSGDSEHEHKEGGVDEDNVSDESSEHEQEHEQEEKGEDCARGYEERSEEKEEDGRSENQSRRKAEDEEKIRRVRVAQSLAMYRAQLAAERRVEEASVAKASNARELRLKFPNVETKTSLPLRAELRMNLRVHIIYSVFQDACWGPVAASWLTI